MPLKRNSNQLLCENSEITDKFNTAISSRTSYSFLQVGWAGLKSFMGHLWPAGHSLTLSDLEPQCLWHHNKDRLPPLMNISHSRFLISMLKDLLEQRKAKGGTSLHLGTYTFYILRTPVPHVWKAGGKRRPAQLPQTISSMKDENIEMRFIKPLTPLVANAQHVFAFSLHHRLCLWIPPLQVCAF